MVKTKITEEWVENRNYKLIPEKDDYWHIEILTGDYSSCHISYTSIKINEQTMELKFDYNLEYTPIEWVKAGDPGLDKTASHILHSILMSTLNENMEDTKPIEVKLDEEEPAAPDGTGHGPAMVDDGWSDETSIQILSTSRGHNQ
jgi:hypothetical protein